MSRAQLSITMSNNKTQHWTN